MIEPVAPQPLGERIAVGVIIERSEYRRGMWSVPRHTLVAVLCGEAMRAPRAEATVLREEGEVAQTLWKGLELRLYPDAAESYWYNLTAPDPRVFVVCRDEEDGFGPVLVTVDPDEANGHLEADDQVLSVALPAELHPLLERYVLEHFRPQPRKKRRRTEWGDDEGQS